MDRKEIKERAKKFAFQNKWNLWKPILVIAGISVIFSMILSALGLNPKLLYEINAQGFMEFKFEVAPAYSVLETIFTIAALPLTVGLMYYVISLVRGNNIEIKDMFSKYKYFLPILIVSVIVAVCAFLWTLLFIIPGIIYLFKVAMVPYLMADELDENTKPMDLINKSKEKMHGHKWEYFVFELSFIGWYLLIFITLGIAAIWVVPYVQTANVMYFEKLKELN